MSLLESSNDTKYDIYVIINNNVTEEDQLLLRKQVAVVPENTITFIPIRGEFDGCYEVRGISTATYSRLLIPWLLPHLDKVIYSDVDVIFKLDLASLYKINMNEYYLSAVRALGSISFLSSHISSIGLKPEEYCNAGILLINCKKQREDNLKEKYLLESKKNYVYQDQDIINIVCKTKINRIDSIFNVTPSFFELVFSKNSLIKLFFETKESINAVLSGVNCIIHYAGKKPWNSFCYAWYYWWDTYRKSIFYDSYFELSISNRILTPSYSWRMILHIIKQKLLKGLCKSYK